jgi:hypothetical protein
MKSGRIVVVLLALALSFPALASAAGKPMLVRYRPWFTAKPFGDAWGWHWTMNRFDPDQFDPAGQRRIASWYRPLIGPYDSGDPAVIEYHLLLMKLAGLDGVIVDWYGPDHFRDYDANDERARAILSRASAIGLKFVLCFEDQAIQQQVRDGRLPAANDVAHAQYLLRYAETNFFNHSAYMRREGRPLLLNFGPQYFSTNAQWEAIFSILAPSNRPAFFTEDNRLPVAEGAFNWPPMWLSLAPGTRGVLSLAALQNYLDQFEEKGRRWPAYISSAFPRFHDIYQSAGLRDYLGYLGDRNGATFRSTLGRALTNQSAYVQIVTWNDFAEGTMIEPTVEYGFRDLGILQEQRRLHLDPQFTYGTNDLVLPLELYQLRRSSATNAALTAPLDAAAAALGQGNVAVAREMLKQFAPPSGRR